MNILILDTADNKEIIVGLKINDREYLEKEQVKFNKGQIILPMIDKILRKHSLSPKDLSEIQINTGPGSFTGLRIGLAIANAMSFVLKIQVNGKRVGKVVTPLYK